MMHEWRGLRHSDLFRRASGAVCDTQIGFEVRVARFATLSPSSLTIQKNASTFL